MFITISIDLSKIDKSKIKKGKNGAKYYNLVVQDRVEPDQYGNNLKVSEPKEKGITANTVYLGSGKLWPEREQQAQPQQQNNPVTNEPWNDYPEGSDDLPF